MKKLLLILLFVPLVSSGQSYSEEKPALIEKIESWGEEKAFKIYRALILTVQDRSLIISENTYKDPNDFIKRRELEIELLEKYKLQFIEKYKEDGMSENMMLALDWYGTNDKNWHKRFKNKYNQ